MTSYIRWAFWSVVYLFRIKPKDLDDWMLRTERTWKPWFKFKPHVWHNDNGKLWEIHLDNERNYSKTVNITLDVEVGLETGKIVGFRIYDSQLQVEEGRMNYGQ